MTNYDWETATPDSLGQRIRRSRKAKGLTQTELAQAIESTQNRISEWEQDQHTPGWSALCRIAHVLEISLDYLHKGR